MAYHDFEYRIPYADTDRMGVVYYANYLVLFERGRTELLRHIGMRYRDLEEKEQLYLPAMEAHIEYSAPAHYDDLIRVRTFVSELGGAFVRFRYEVSNTETGVLVARGTTKHPVVNRRWRPTRLPPELRRRLKEYLSK
jgi:acyl-CoA thioester hydrolase